MCINIVFDIVKIKFSIAVGDYEPKACKDLTQNLFSYIP